MKYITRQEKRFLRRCLIENVLREERAGKYRLTPVRMSVRNDEYMIYHCKLNIYRKSSDRKRQAGTC